MYSKAVSLGEAAVLYKDLAKDLQEPGGDDVEMPVADLFDLQFGEGGTVTDLSAHNAAIISGSDAAVTSFNEEIGRWVSTLEGGWYRYFGVDYSADDAIKSAFANGFSFEFAYRFDEAQYTCPMSATENAGVGFEQTEEGKINFYYGTTGGYDTLNGTLSVDPGKWNHIVATFDGTGKKLSLYVNGQFAGSKVITKGDFNLPEDTDAQWIGIGGDAHAGGWTQDALTGDVAIARMYGRVLSQAEVAKLFGAMKAE